jgi:hypothetical protein
MNRLPASQRYRRHVDRWKRYEKPQPGHRVQIKFVAPLRGSRKRYYQFTAIDDCTRIRAAAWRAAAKGRLRDVKPEAQAR